MTPRGYFVTFEGAEGSGKSTQIKRAARHLRRKGYAVLVLREPGGTRTSEAIRKILLDKKLHQMRPETELLLYLAARAQLVREKIEPSLKQGKIVILDRYEDSTLAYQGYGGGIPIPLIRKLSRLVRGKRVPPLTFLLDIETERGLRRSGRRDRIEKKSVAFHRRVRQGFLKLARREPKRFVVLSSQEPIKKVWKQIEKKLNALF